MSKLLFEVESQEIINEDTDSQFATARILAFSSGKNRHNYVCSEETLQKTAHTLNYKPIVYLIDNIFQDFGTHSKDAGKSLIAGFILPDSQEFVKMEDGRLGLYVIAKIWKRYADKFMQFMIRDDGKKSVSVEMDLFEFSENSEDKNFSNMDSFIYTAVCVLGDLIQEASPDANLQMLTFAKEQAEYNKAVLLEFGKYEGLDFTIPKKVKENAQRGLDLRKKLGRGGTSVGISTAKYLISNTKASPEKVRHIAKYFPRHAGDNLDDKESNGWVAWNLWGSDAGRSWSNKLVRQMNAKDETNMSFFTSEENVLFNIDSKEETIVTEEEKMAQEEAEKAKMSVDETETPEPEKDFAEEVKPAPEKDEEESEEPKEQDEPEKDEPKEEDMSLDAYADVPAMLAMLGAETEQAKGMANMFAEKKEVDWSIMAKGLYALACKMAEDASEKEKAYMAENELLMAFKKGQEEKEFNFAVAGIISKVEEVLPSDKLDEVKESVKNFSLETFEDFKNKTLALAFEYGKDKKKKKEETPEYVSYAFPVVDSVKVSDSPWGVSNLN